MQHTFTFPALVIRECDYGENDKLLTLLTAEKGKITVCVKGAKSIRSKNMASSQLLCYSEFVIKERGGFYTLSEAALIEQFFGLRQNLDRYAAAQYVADVAGEVCVENTDESEMLSLTLNTLYMLSQTERNADEIKAVFEIRCASLAGFMPNLSGCSFCGKTNYPQMYLDVMNGMLKCGECFGTVETQNYGISDFSTATIVIPLTQCCLDAMRYAVNCPPKRIFSYQLPETERNGFCNVCEKYLINQIERSFKTLDFYKSVRNLG